MAIITAFQSDTFQTNAFQIDVTTPSTVAGPLVQGTILTNKRIAPSRHISKREFFGMVDDAGARALLAERTLRAAPLEELLEMQARQAKSGTRNYALEDLIAERIKSRDARNKAIEEAKERIRQHIKKIRGH